MKKALIIQPAFIGDAVISIALANALKLIDTTVDISVLVRPEATELLSFAPSVTRVIPFDKYGKDSGTSGLRAIADEINMMGFDIALSLHNSQRTHELLKRLNIPIKIGYGDDNVFTHQIQAVATDDACNKAARLSRALDPRSDISCLPTLVLPDALLPSDFKRLKHPIIGMAPGSVWQTKRWPSDKVLTLIDSLSKAGNSVVLIGQAKDMDVELVSLRSREDNRFVNYVSKLSLASSASVIANLDVLISTDSAPVHIAVATGTPVVDILGPTIKEFGFAPRVESGKLVEALGLWCRPCTSHGSRSCPIQTFECMNSLGVEMVMGALESLSKKVKHLSEF